MDVLQAVVELPTTRKRGIEKRGYVWRFATGSAYDLKVTYASKYAVRRVCHEDVSILLERDGVEKLKPCATGGVKVCISAGDVLTKKSGGT